MSIKTNLEGLENKINSGKGLLATAITNKGVSTPNNATLETMATNVASIAQGGGSEVPISQLKFPEIKQVATISGNPHVMEYYYDSEHSREFYIFPDAYMNKINFYNDFSTLYGYIGKYNGGYEVIEKYKVCKYSISYEDNISYFALDNNYTLYAGYGNANHIQSQNLYYSNPELSNNTSLSSLTDIQQIFTVDKIGLCLAINSTGVGYFVFPLGQNYNFGYVYKSVNDIVGEAVDFSELIGDFNRNIHIQTKPSEPDIKTSTGPNRTVDFNPMMFHADDNYLLLVNNNKIYRINYQVGSSYQPDNYENFLSYNDSISCSETIYTYGLDYPYLYASGRYSNHFSVDLSNHFGNMQVINNMHGNCYKYTKIGNNFYSIGRDSIYLMVAGDKSGSSIQHEGLSIMRSGISFCTGDGENIKFTSNGIIFITQFKDNKFHIYYAINDKSYSILRKNLIVNKDGDVITINSGSVYKLEKDPKVTL